VIARPAVRAALARGRPPDLLRAGMSQYRGRAVLHRAQLPNTRTWIQPGQPLSRGTLGFDSLRPSRSLSMPIEALGSMVLAFTASPPDAGRNSGSITMAGLTGGHVLDH
jgi:hypothetical protein